METSCVVQRQNPKIKKNDYGSALFTFMANYNIICMYVYKTAKYKIKTKNGLALYIHVAGT